MKTATALQIFYRTAAALLGGYLLATLSGIALTFLSTALFGSSRQTGMELGYLLSFPIYAGYIMWAFAATDVRRAWTGLVVPVSGCLALIAVSFIGGRI